MGRFSVNYELDTLRGDVFGAVTCMVVAPPAALGFSIATGMGAAAGLYGAITVGFFASVLFCGELRPRLKDRSHV